MMAKQISFNRWVFGWTPVHDAHADANSYQAYLADHHVSTGLNSPSKNLSARVLRLPSAPRRPDARPDCLQLSFLVWC